MVLCGLRQFVIPGGALDPHLRKEGEVFPMDDEGKPTYRPSAGWYMAQVDFRSALNFKGERAAPWNIRALPAGQRPQLG